MSSKTLGTDIFLPDSDEKSWPLRLNYSLGVERITKGDKPEAIRRSKLLAQIVRKWRGRTVKVKAWPSNPKALWILTGEIEALHGCEVFDRSNLISLRVYQECLNAQNGTVEKMAAYGFETQSIGCRDSFGSHLRLSRDDYGDAIEDCRINALVSYCLDSIRLFPELSGTPFDIILGNTPTDDVLDLHKTLEGALLDIFLETLLQSSEIGFGNMLLTILDFGIVPLGKRGNEPHKFLCK